MSAPKPTLDALRIDRRDQPERGKRGWMGGALVLALLVASAAWWFTRSEAIEVRTVPARAAAVSGERTLLNASGYVTARRSATVSSKVTGKVVDVKVEEGMQVEGGQVLARLDASNTEASLRLAEAQLESARKSIEETAASLGYAEKERKRFADLGARKVVSESEVNRADSEAGALAARAARQEAEIAVAEREVAQWKQQLDDTIIRAPFDGIVTSKNAQPGEMISPMSVGGFTRTGICTIVDMSSLEVEVDVSESYINLVQAGQPVEATLDAYPTWRIPAKVVAIIPTADRQKATVKVRVAFEELDPRILPEMAVKVAFQSANGETGTAARANVLVPKDAVQEKDGRDIVWVVRDGRVERRAVTVAQKTGDKFSIAAGLEVGEHVAVDPPSNLTDGGRVKVIKP